MWNWPWICAVSPGDAHRGKSDEPSSFHDRNANGDLCASTRRWKRRRLLIWGAPSWCWLLGIGIIFRSSAGVHGAVDDEDAAESPPRLLRRLAPDNSCTFFVVAASWLR